MNPYTINIAIKTTEVMVMIFFKFISDIVFFTESQACCSPYLFDFKTVMIQN